MAVPVVLVGLEVEIVCVVEVLVVVFSEVVVECVVGVAFDTCTSMSSYQSFSAWVRS